jgi:hypothetical protein
MVKVKVSELSLNSANNGVLPEVEFKAFVVKNCKDDETFSDKSIKNDYIILMSETEYRDKISSKAGRKSNPLMLNFEEYN